MKTLLYKILDKLDEIIDMLNYGGNDIINYDEDEEDLIYFADYLEEKGIKNKIIYGRKATQKEVNEFLGYRVNKFIDEGIVSINENCEFFVIDGETCVLIRAK